MKVTIPLMALLLASCANELEDRLDELEAENADLRYALEATQSAVEVTRYAIDAARDQASEAQSESERFGYEDWSYVVSDMQSETEATVSLIEDASASLEEAEQAVSGY